MNCTFQLKSMTLKQVNGLKELILIGIDTPLFYMVYFIIKENTLIFHGGFEPEKPNLPLETLVGLDLTKVTAFASRIQKNEVETKQ
jgi:hypothetical protein